MINALSYDETMSGGGDGLQINNIVKKPIQWSLENEEILVEWGDIAQCYKWLTTYCYLSYCYYHAWFTIPTIIFSTITGTAIFAQLHVGEVVQLYIQISIGFINISIGILNTLLQYLRISEMKELYKSSSLGWDKLARNIRIELAKTPYERNDANHFIKLCRQEFNRLMEMTPLIDEKTIKQFIKTFAGETGTQQRREYELLKKPDICDELVSIDKNRKHWFINEFENMDEKFLSSSQQNNKQTMINLATNNANVNANTTIKLPYKNQKIRRSSTNIINMMSPNRKRKISNNYVIPITTTTATNQGSNITSILSSYKNAAGTAAAQPPSTEKHVKLTEAILREKNSSDVESGRNVSLGMGVGVGLGEIAAVGGGSSHQL